MKSIRRFLTSRYMWAFGFIVCWIITLALVVSNTKDQCTWSFKGISIHGSGGCNEHNIPDDTCSTAAIVKRNDVTFSWTGETYENSPMWKKCSWHIHTSFFNYLAIVCDLVFVVLFLKNFRRGSFKRILASGGAAMGAILIATILMIIDSKSGSKHNEKSKAKYSQTPLEFSQGIFVSNIAFSILSLIFVIILVFVSFRAQRANRKNPENGYNVPKKAKSNPAQANGPEDNNTIRI